jgi:phospholipid/cholesterol/gamma-HCH transport system permease protein
LSTPPSALGRLTSYLPWKGGHRREFVRNFLLQVYFTFVQSWTMVSFLGLGSGVAIAFQANMGLVFLGTDNQLGKLLVFIIFRELCPLAASLLLITRSATAMAAELATIKVQQEIEALQIMGISVYHYLLAPRIAGGMVSLFCMAVTFWAFALIGGYVGANLSGDYPMDHYLTSISRSLRPADIVLFLLKTVLVGAVVSRIACSRGLSLVNAPFEVPIVTNRAVVDALTTALAIHVSLSGAFYLIYGVSL